MGTVGHLERPAILIASLLAACGATEPAPSVEAPITVAPFPAEAPTAMEPADRALEVGVGERFSCARYASGAVRCWGSNADGRAGLGERTESAVPTVVEGLPPATALAVGDRHACILDATGTPTCWGHNRECQVGGAPSDRLGPTAVALTGAVEIDASARHTCVRDAEGRVFCWGGWYVAGRPTREGAEGVPREIRGVRAASLELGDQTSCALREDHTLVCWGFATAGLFGPVSGPFARPRPIEGVRVARLAIGDGHACLVDDAGWLRCAGHDRAGELIGDDVPDRASCQSDDDVVTCTFSNDVPSSPMPPDNPRSGLPAPPAPPPSPPITLTRPARRGLSTARDGHDALLLEAAGASLVGRTCVGGASGIRCWGATHHVDWSHRSHPPPIEGTESVTQFDISPHHGCAVVHDLVTCWGENRSGELGDGTHESRDVSRPVASP